MNSSNLRRRVEAEDLGQWKTFAKDPDGTVVDWRVRRLTADVARRLQRQKVKVKGNVTVVDVPVEERRQRAEALYCWTGVRNQTVTAEDESASKLYAKLCPGVQFPVGEPVVIDGCLTEALKEDILTTYPECVDWVRKRAKAMQAVVDDEEEEAQGN